MDWTGWQDSAGVATIDDGSNQNGHNIVTETAHVRPCSA